MVRRRILARVHLPARALVGAAFAALVGFAACAGAASPTPSGLPTRVGPSAVGSGASGTPSPGSPSPSTATPPSGSASASPAATPPVSASDSTAPPSTGTTGPSPSDCAATGAAAAAPATIPTSATPPKLALSEVTSGFAAPIGLVAAPGETGRLYVVEQGGLVRILDNGTVLATPFLDVRVRTNAGGERGLLGLAFHPQYVCNGRLFIDYTDTSGDTVVEEYRASHDADAADPEPVARLLHIDQPFPNHNGGDLVFGPDGLLYVGMGDGGSAGDPQGNGQRPDTMLGKMLRLDVDNPAPGVTYGTPVDNCRGCPAEALPEIYAFGVRNPWRFSFDRETGDLWIGDVGQGDLEEIDHIAVDVGSGANFGWNRMEGSACYPSGASCDSTGLTFPVAEYDHAGGDCSVTGGYVYRGPETALAGWYLFSDYCTGTIRALSTAFDATPVVALATQGNIATFGEDAAGNLYVADISRGTVSQIVVAP